MKHITGNWTYTIGGILSCPICGKRDKIIGIDGAYECGRCDISPTKYVANMQSRIEELEAKNKELTQALADLDKWICIAEELDFLLDEYGRSTEPMTPKAEEVRDWMQVHVIKPQERIAELETEVKVYKSALIDAIIDRTLGGNDPLAQYVADAREKIKRQVPEEQ